MGRKISRSLKLSDRLSRNLQEEVALQTNILHRQNSKLEKTKKALIAANENLKKLSITDGLTQLYNRMYFEKEYRKEWRRCVRQQSPISILMIDVDHFKSLNDSAGHLAGDYALQAIAKTLSRHVKRAGELAARYGGEEFVVMLPETDQRKALAVAEGLRHAIEKLSIHHNDQQHQVTISIGISVTTPVSTLAPDHLLEAADAALYQAKNSGRNKVAIIPLLGRNTNTQIQRHSK